MPGRDRAFLVSVSCCEELHGTRLYESLTKGWCSAGWPSKSPQRWVSDHTALGSGKDGYCLRMLRWNVGDRVSWRRLLRNESLSKRDFVIRASIR